MKFGQAIDLFLEDMRTEGRITSDASERSYRDALNLHAADVNNRDPRTTNRDDVKTTLGRWTNTTTQATRRAYLVSFYDWCLEEGHRKDNPARQTRRPKRRKADKYRLTRHETAALLRTTNDFVERRVAYLGICAGLRSAELRGLQRRHFERDGFIHITSDIGKGSRERWLPIIEDAKPIVAEILANVGPDDYVLPGQIVAQVGPPIRYRYHPTSPMGATTLWRLVGALGKRAGISAHISPHHMRHAHADHITRVVSLDIAQEMLGHADISTTRGYTGTKTLEELEAAVRNVSFLTPFGLPPAEAGGLPKVETVGIEPTLSTSRVAEGFGRLLVGLRGAFVNA